MLTLAVNADQRVRLMWYKKALVWVGQMSLWFLFQLIQRCSVSPKWRSNPVGNALSTCMWQQLAAAPQSRGRCWRWLYLKSHSHIRLIWRLPACASLARRTLKASCCLICVLWPRLGHPGAAWEMQLFGNGWWASVKGRPGVSETTWQHQSTLMFHILMAQCEKSW